MVLCLKARESRSLPGLLVTLFAYNGLVKTFFLYLPCLFFSRVLFFKATGFFGAGWSSPVARQAHNLKVAGSNPAPATNITNFQKTLASGCPTSSCLNIGQLKHIPVKIFGGCVLSILLKVQ